MSIALLEIEHIDKDIFMQQQTMVSVLKGQIIRLQQKSNEDKIQMQLLELELAKSRQQIVALKEKIQFISENNQSLLQTVSVFQKEFIKHPEKQGIQIDVLKAIKNKLTKTKSSVTARSNVCSYYGSYLLQNSIEQLEAQLFNQVVQNNSNPSKIKAYGRKKYFSQNFRYLFWYNAIQNKLKINQRLYEILSNRLQKQNMVPSKTGKVSIIDQDLRRMDLKLQNQKSTQLSTQIKLLLETFQVYRPDIRYVQGMSYLAWILLIRMNSFQSFVCFSNLLLCDPFINAIYTFQQSKLNKIVQRFDECLQEKLPKVRKHMQTIGVESGVFLFQWAYTFYARTFSLRIVAKIWDLWFSQGYSVFFRVALTLFMFFENSLLDKKQPNEFLDLIKKQSYKVQQGEFLKAIMKNKLTKLINLDDSS